MRKLSDLGLTGWDPDRVTAWVMAVPVAEIPDMIEWLGDEKGAGDDSKSRYAVSVAAACSIARATVGRRRSSTPALRSGPLCSPGRNPART